MRGIDKGRVVWNLVARISLFLVGMLLRIRARILSYLKKAEDWLYKQDVTPRRIKHALRPVIWGVILLLSAVGSLFVLLLVYLSLTSGLGALATELVNQLLQGLVRLVEPFKMINASELVTIIAATFVVSVGAAIVGLIRGPLRVSNLPSPLIAIRDGDSYYHEESDSRVHALVVSNYGETAAIACQARITFIDIEQRDIIDIAGMSAKFTHENFKSIIKSELRWNTGLKEVTIRSGDNIELEVLRTVEARIDVIEHFEVPSDEGWRSMTVMLAPHRYYGEIRVVPLNGKFCATSFEIRPDKEKKRCVFTVM